MNYLFVRSDSESEEMFVGELRRKRKRGINGAAEVVLND